LAPAALRARAAALPGEIAGIRLPRTPLTLAAAQFAKARCPEYLFNHCMRTYLFGALQLRRRQRSWQAADAFVAAALHDLGLLPAFESAAGSFETDGANVAEHWVLQNRGTVSQADLVWHAVQMHDGAWALTRRQGPEAMLVALGAGTDVDGADPGELEAGAEAEVLAAFPRLQFKREFTALIAAHCERKPNSQRATWLEGSCRRHAQSPLPDDAVEKRIAAAAFSE
jgi:hypothetical protein